MPKQNKGGIVLLDIYIYFSCSM